MTHPLPYAHLADLRPLAPPPTSPLPKISAPLVAVALFAITFLTLMPSLAGSWLTDPTFATDDRIYIGLRPLGAGLMSALTPPTHWPTAAPVAAILALIQRAAFDEIAPGYRAVSLLLHASVAFSLYLLLRRLRTPAPFLAAAFFAILPSQVDPAAAIRSQPILLSALLSIWSIWFYLRPAPPRATLRFLSNPLFRRIASLALAALAAFAHPISASIPVVALIIIFWQNRRLTRRDLIDIAPLAAVSIILCIIVELTWPAEPAARLWQLKVISSILLRFEGIGFYLATLLWPAAHAFRYPDWSNDYVVEGFVLLAALFFTVVAWLTRDRIGPGPFVCAALMLALLLPPDIFGIWNATDSMTYFAAAALAVSLAGLVSLAPIPYRNPLAAILLFALAFGFVHQSRWYATPDLAWDQVAQRDPDWPPVIAARALSDLIVRQNFDQAEADFTRLLSIEPKSTYALLGLARVAEFRGHPEQALDHLHQAVALAPRDPNLHHSLGFALERTSNLSAAREQYQAALDIDRDDPVALTSLARLDVLQNQLDDAADLLQRAAAANPWYASAVVSLAAVRQRQQRTEEAAALYEFAIKVDPNSAEAYEAAGAFYAQSHQLDKAADYFRRALALNLNSARVFFQLARILDAQNNPDALQCMAQAAVLDRANPALQQQAQHLLEKYFPDLAKMIRAATQRGQAAP